MYVYRQSLLPGIHPQKSQKSSGQFNFLYRVWVCAVAAQFESAKIFRMGISRPDKSRNGDSEAPTGEATLKSACTVVSVNLT